MAFRPAAYGEAPRHDDPGFVRAAEWLSRPAGDDPIARVAGAPYSHLSISGARCDLLPGAVREALWTLSTYGRGADLNAFAVHDAGDIEPFDGIEDACRTLAGRPVALIGGDNSVTAPAVTGLVGTGASLVAIDAHHDVRAGVSNGSPVRNLLEAGLDGRRVHQLGIAPFANSAVYAAFARDAGILAVPVEDVRRRGLATVLRDSLDVLPAPVYVDLDVDVCDRALAPAAPAAVSGGLSPTEVLDAAFVAGAHPNVRALDIVEVDPTRDVNGVTVRLAAQILLSFLAGVASR
jgi:formiminoglutamase